MTTNNNVNIDALLDGTLDDLADMPSNVPYPAGAHQVLASFELKEIGGKSAVELSFVYVEVLDLNDANDVAPKAGDTSSTLFFLDSDYGQGAFKKAAAAFSELGFASNRELIEGVKSIECAITSTVREDKRDPANIKHHLSLKEIQMI